MTSLKDMRGGWFVGNFQPTVLETDTCEVAVKHYAAGDSEDEHLHAVAVEITVVISGTVEMLGRTWTDGSIVTVPPGRATGFRALTDCWTVVVKIPSVPGDKYVLDGQTRRLRGEQQSTQITLNRVLELEEALEEQRQRNLVEASLLCDSWSRLVCLDAKAAMCEKLSAATGLELEKARVEAERLALRLRDIESSRSWRLTGPLRRARRAIRLATARQP